jgi:hypothetical protein
VLRSHLVLAATVAASLAVPLSASSAWAQPAAPPPPPPAAQPAQPQPAPPPPPSGGGWFPAPGTPPSPAGPPAAPPPAAAPPPSPPPAGAPPPLAPTATPAPGDAAATAEEKKPAVYPARLRWEPGDPVPQGFEPTSRPSLGLLVGGAVLFGVAYIPSLGIAAGDEDTDFLPLAIPLAGPFITMRTAESQDAATFWLGVDGVVQIAGATMFITSFITRQHYLKKQPTPMLGTATGPHADLGVGPGSFTMKGGF